MTEDNPNLIPPPSIGESKSSSAPVAAKPKKRSMLLLVIALCVLVGVGLGVVVYQKSITPAPTPTPRPSLAPRPSPSPSTTTPDVSVVTPTNQSVTFPKAGRVRVYYSGFDPNNPGLPGNVVRLTATNGQSDLLATALKSGDKMHILDSGLNVVAGQSVKVEIFEDGDETTPADGWTAATAANKCGSGQGQVDGTVFVDWAKTKAESEPLVAIMCWGDHSRPGDTSSADYNDYFMILSYVPASQAASPSPSASASVKPSSSPSASPSPSASAPAGATPTPTPSPRVTVPDASSLPDAGVFEVTAGTAGVGLILLILGAVGLLLL